MCVCVWGGGTLFDVTVGVRSSHSTFKMATLGNCSCVRACVLDRGK